MSHWFFDSEKAQLAFVAKVREALPPGLGLVCFVVSAKPGIISDYACMSNLHDEDVGLILWQYLSDHPQLLRRKA